MDVITALQIWADHSKQIEKIKCLTTKNNYLQSNQCEGAIKLSERFDHSELSILSLLFGIDLHNCSGEIFVYLFIVYSAILI